MARTPQEAFETHLEALGSGDLDRLAADYSEDCIQISNRQIYKGKAGVKDGFAQIFADLSAVGEVTALEVPTRVYEGNVLYIEWWAQVGDSRCEGVDTFVFEDGLITIQTVKYDIV